VPCEYVQAQLGRWGHLLFSGAVWSVTQGKIGCQANESEMEEESDSSLWGSAGETGMDSWDSVRTTEALQIGEAVPLHAVPNGYAAYSQHVGSLGFVALCLGKGINELLFL
jgi:hypothetical protein